MDKQMMTIINKVRCPFCEVARGQKCLNLSSNKEMITIHAARTKYYEKTTLRDSRIDNSIPKESKEKEPDYRYVVEYTDGEEVMYKGSKESVAENIFGEEMHTVSIITRLIYDCEMKMVPAALIPKK